MIFAVGVAVGLALAILAGCVIDQLRRHLDETLRRALRTIARQ